MAYYRKTKAGWRVEIERRGVRTSKTFGTKSAAQQWAAREESAILDGAVSRWPRKTLADALHKYALEVTTAKRGARAEGLRLVAVERDYPALAAKLLHEITVADLASWRDARLALVAPSSVQRDINILRHVWTVASREWQWCPTPTPWASLRMPASVPPRDRLLGWREIRRLMRRCDYRTGVPPVTQVQAVGWALLVSLRTAMRAGEVVGLTVGAVDLRSRVVTLADHKTAHQVGKRHVPLTHQGARVLGWLAAAAGEDGRLFRLPAWSVVCRNSGVPSWSPSRRTVGSTGPTTGRRLCLASATPARPVGVRLPWRWAACGPPALRGRWRAAGSYTTPGAPARRSGAAA